MTKLVDMVKCYFFWMGGFCLAVFCFSFYFETTIWTAFIRGLSFYQANLFMILTAVEIHTKQSQKR